MAAATAVALLGGCGAGSSGPAAVSATTFILDAATATDAATTARITRTFVTMAPGSLNVPSVTTGVYDFATRDGYLVSTSGVSVGGTGPDVRFIGHTVFVRTATPSSASVPTGLLPGKTWVADVVPAATGPAAAVADLFVPWGSVDPMRLLGELASDATSVTDVGRQEVQGVPTTEYSVVLHTFGASQCQAGQFGPGHPVDVWIDTAGRARQVVLHLAFSLPRTPYGPATSFTSTSTDEYSDFGVPVAVTPPPPAEVETAQQQRQVLVQQERALASRQGSSSLVVGGMEEKTSAC